jgi:glutamate formiminotransferase/formiminotetrahydrofolate cyclodeaminase
MPRLVECVPNFSEGRNRSVIDAIADAIRGVADVKLLDVDPGADTNRTVYTFVGTPEAVAEAAVRSAKRAYELIDMSTHSGAHPRIGAMDVCPIVPISGVTMEEAAEIARGIGRRIGDELQVPVYFYEYAATSEERRSPRRRAGPLRPAVRRARGGRPRVPHRLQRQPEHPRPKAGERDRARHPGERPAEA